MDTGVTGHVAMSKAASVRASVRDCEEKEVVVDESVTALGFGFLHLPPTRYAPLVIKTVKQDSWADLQGIIPGSELIELEGQEAGRLSAEEFRQVLKQRPLRLKLAPPHGEVWKQVAAFQQQVVALSLQKVHLQQALKDESDRVMRELGICTELEKSNSMQHKAKVLKDQAQRLQEKQALEEEMDKLKAELQTCHLQMDVERQQMEAERSKFQEDLQEASQLATDHATQRSLLEEQLKDLQAKMDSSTAQLTELTAQLDSEREARQQLDVENSRLQASCAESEAQVQRCKGELEAARKGTLEAETSQLAELQRSRASLEQERQQLVASQAELQLEKNHQAAEKLELEAMRKSLEEKDPHLQQAVSELSKLRVALTSAQPELQSLLSHLATSELFKVESSPPAAAVPGPSAVPGPARRSYARRSVVPVAAPAADKESDEEMF